MSSRSSPWPVSDHFDGREFHNLYGAPAGGSLGAVLRWKLLGGGGVPWPERVETGFVPLSLPAAVPENEVSVTFVGHSTFLLQFAGGLNVLTDPIWSDRASPVTFAGPRRARRPGLEFGFLPKVDVVLISHGHYDHLDLPTLRCLERRFQPLFITGLGNGEFFGKEGFQRVQELDWWESYALPGRGEAGLKVTFTPAQHWSARSWRKRNRTLWGGFWLQPGGSGRVYFAADSGYAPLFRLIHERLGTPDLAFLPIGAYEPRWFMREQHMNPEEAVRAHLDLAARLSIAMHFGTFRLTDEGIDQPQEALAIALRTQGADPATFRVSLFGETIRARLGTPS